MILAGDVGGTSARLAYFEWRGEKLYPQVVEKYPSHEAEGLDAIVREFVRAHPATIERAAFALPGPVVEGRVKTTNLPWLVEAASLARTIDIPSAGLLNDLEANTYGIFMLEPSDFAVLNAGAPNARGNIAVISAGTGLGEGGAAWDGERYVVFPTEGGHTDFAPRDEIEVALMLHLRERFHEHVSYERVVSGPGLVNVYEFLRDTGQGVEETWVREAMEEGDPSAVISQAGLEGKSALCERALDMFVSMYGAEAGNLALKLYALGGVYIGGGIAPKILPKLTSGLFMDAFVAKGRHHALLKTMPVKVVLNDDAALFGAAYYAIQL